MAPLDLAERERFSDPSLFILCSLAAGPRHGYAITRDIEGFAGVTLGPGTLYGALGRLQRLGLVEQLPEQDRRRPWRLSELGATVLRAQLASAQQVVDTGRRRLAGEPADPPPRRRRDG
jgi:DNA-binding PadR family transcriptional regulator